MMMRAGLFAGVLATLIAGPALAQQGGYLSVEGGLACSRSKAYEVIDVPPVIKLGDDGCGARGAIEIGRTGTPVFSVFDHWAIRGRFTRFTDKEAVGGLFPFEASFSDRRFVLDAEVGTRFEGLNFFGGVSRVVLGLRYATWRGQLKTVDAIGDEFTDTMTTSGIGPRIGLRSTIPLGTHFMYESQMGVAALFSRHKGQDLLNGIDFGSARDSGAVFSFDSNSAISYKLNGTEQGPVISVGLFSEYWFRQSVVGIDGTERVNRHSWGPFARFRMPLQ